MKKEHLAGIAPDDRIAAELKSAYDRRQAITHLAKEDLLHQVRRARAAGFGYGRIGKAIGISKSRAQSLAREAAGLPPK